MTPNSNSCPLQTGNADVLLSYCSHMLDPERTELIERHMTVCMDCQAWADDQKQVWAAMDLWEAEPVSAGFDEALLAKIAASEKTPFWERMWAPIREWLAGDFRWKPAFPLAAAGVVLATGLYVQNPFAPEVVAVKMETQELEQAERALEDIEMLKQLEVAPEDEKNI